MKEKVYNANPALKMFCNEQTKKFFHDAIASRLIESVARQNDLTTQSRIDFNHKKRLGRKILKF